MLLLLPLSSCATLTEFDVGGELKKVFQKQQQNKAAAPAMMKQQQQIKRTKKVFVASVSASDFTFSRLEVLDFKQQQVVAASLSLAPKSKILS